MTLTLEVKLSKTVGAAPEGDDTQCRAGLIEKFPTQMAFLRIQGRQSAMQERR